MNKVTFELSLSKNDFERFFNAVEWSLPELPPCPPTIATIFRDGEFEILRQLNIPLKKVLHGEQKYRFYSDLKPDTKYRGETFLENLVEKNKMSFFVLQTNLIDEETGKATIECTSTIIARGLKDKNT